MAEHSTSEITRVFFIRHGVTAQTGTILYGQNRGIDLSEEGRTQAQQMAEHLSNIHIDALYSSPLERAHQTAEIIGDSCDLEVTLDDRLMDTHIGDWAGMTIKECIALPEWKAVEDTPMDVTFPNGESFVQLFERMDEAINEFVQKNIGKNIVVISHQDPIIMLLAHYLGLDKNLLQRLKCDPAALCEVRFYDGKASVYSVNVLPKTRMV